MKFCSKFYLKWFNADNELLKGCTYKMINICTLTGENEQKKVIGFTSFETKDLNEVFFSKLILRKNQTQFQNIHFKLYLPLHQKNVVKNILNKFEPLPLTLIFTSFVEIVQSQNFFFIRDRLRVINVDDSEVILKFLKKSFSEMEFVDVVAQVSNSLEAVDTIHRLKPDLITLDIQMPQKSGVEVLIELLTIKYYPVIMISSLSLNEGSLVFTALYNGAFDFIQKPKLEEQSVFRDELLEKTLLAVEGKKINPSTIPSPKTTSLNKSSQEYIDHLFWCLGASTGGTQAITKILTALPAQIPPTLIVQHIPPVYSRSFAASLNQLCPFTVKEAEHGEPILANQVYIAPGGFQMGLQKKGESYQIILRDDPPLNRFKPSVDYLFHEIALHSDLQVIAGVLTGMGRDGAQGLLELKNRGSRTFVQNEESCAVFGMPRVAIELGGCENILPLDLIAEHLLKLSFKFKKVSGL